MAHEAKRSTGACCEHELRREKIRQTGVWLSAFELSDAKRDTDEGDSEHGGD